MVQDFSLKILTCYPSCEQMTEFELHPGRPLRVLVLKSSPGLGLSPEIKSRTGRQIMRSHYLLIEL